MLDDWMLSLIYAAFVALSTMPVAFMLGSECSPCCGCTVVDGKPRTDPADEGTWVPSGTWDGAEGVTWSFTENPGDGSGETWFFFGSASTSRVGGGASTSERRDWGNICNWYSSKSTAPNFAPGVDSPVTLTKRATRLPPETAVVHIYGIMTTHFSGPVTVSKAYFWSDSGGFYNETSVLPSLTATSTAHDTSAGVVFLALSRNYGIVNSPALFLDRSANYGEVAGDAFFLFYGLTGSAGGNLGNVSGDATFSRATNAFSGVVGGDATLYPGSVNAGIIQGFATLFDSTNQKTINGGAIFNGSGGLQQSSSFGALTVVNGGAVFNDGCRNVVATVNGGAVFNDSAMNQGNVNGGATFNNSARNGNPNQTNVYGIVNGGATFNNTSQNYGSLVYGGATFNDDTQNTFGGGVYGGATFNDAACTTTAKGNFNATPCTRQFVVHPTDLPTCSGSAPNGCTAGSSCGCG